jgi:tRNA nucleotidyltransferase (CCA-adding enzyme)
MDENLADLISEKLPGPVFRLIETAGRAARGSDVDLYLVGGIVRDLLLGRHSGDIDMMVEGNALQLAATLAAKLDKKPVLHKRFGTATFKLGDYRIDLATCRSESYDHPGALPTVKPGNIKQDLFRRDFTINALAVCLKPGRLGRLIDHYGGQQDLEDKLVRILHAKSFQDDATRIMRAVRYEQRLGFKLEPVTLKTLGRDLDMLDTISGDRLRHELILWMGEAQPEKILKRAGQMGILSRLNASLAWNPIWKKTFPSARKLFNGTQLIQLYFALLIYNLDKKQCDTLLKRLGIDGGQFSEIAADTLKLKDKLDPLDKSDLKPSEIYAKLSRYSQVAIQANALCSSSLHVRRNLKLFLDRLASIKTHLNGKDLIQMGIPEGRKVGLTLERILIARIDGEVRTRADEVSLVRQLIKGW